MPVLDTNLLIHLSHHKPHAIAVLKRLQAEEASLLVPAAAAVEYLAGIDPITPSFHRLHDDFTLVHTSDDIVVRSAELYRQARRKGTDKPGWSDVLIAAVASLEGTYVVTTNKRHFTQLGVPAWNYETEREPPPA